MQNDSKINSSLYWDQRFHDNWEQAGGPHQSRFFAHLARVHLPEWLFQEIRRDGLKVADWGCAQGDGTDALTTVIEPANLTGIDFSAVAIAQAARRYPGLEFVHEDWLVDVGGQARTYDIVFTSNVLEHFHRPYDVIDRLAKRARLALVLALPYREMDRIHEHFFTFLAQNIPIELGNGFRLFWSKVVDCRRIPDNQWGGDQVFLIFAAPEWVTRMRLCLADVRLDQSDIHSDLSAMGERLEEQRRIAEAAKLERSELSVRLTDAVTAHHAEVGNLRRELAAATAALLAQTQEREELAVNLARVTADHERQSGELKARSLEYEEQRACLVELKARLSEAAAEVQELRARHDEIAEQLGESESGRALHVALQAARDELAMQAETVENLKRRCNFYQYRATSLERSTSWRVTRPLRIASEATRLAIADPRLTGKRLSHLRLRLRREGLGPTARWMLKRLANEAPYVPPQALVTPEPATTVESAAPAIEPIVARPELTPRDRQYRDHVEAEYRRLSEQMNLESDDRRFAEIRDSDKQLILAPAAYDLSMTQRPDHVLRALARTGRFECVLIEFNGSDLHLTKRETGLYVTNDIAGLFRIAKPKRPIVYLHYALFAYMLRLFPQAYVVYDVLDAPEIFADHCSELDRDHDTLLRDADVVLFSAPMLRDRFSSKCRQHLLVPNGVWVNDFAVRQTGSQVRDRVLRIGYHGAISELLDFELLSNLAALPDVELTLLGPVVAFDASRKAELDAHVDRLRSRPNVAFLGKQPYEEVRDYLERIDLGIVPFVPSPATNPVSPLKLFEFVAAGKPVIATPTSTVAHYDDAITVLPAGDIVDVVARRSWKAVDPKQYARILETHGWDALVGDLASLMTREAPLKRQRRSVGPSRSKLDIVNVNFFDWNGEVLYKGGAERYVADLAEIANGLGYDARILQKGNYPFERTFQGIPVHGVVEPSSHWNFTSLSSALARAVQAADLVIASPLELACGLNSRHRVIGINHGIHWDTDLNRHTNRPSDDLVIAATANCETVVCVDTNFINWFRTVDWPLSQKLQYVPNYVGPEFFNDADRDFSGPLNVLYPRRLYKARGLYMTIDAFDRLFTQFNDVRLTFCGQADETDTRNVREFMRRHDGRVDWIELEMDAMPEAYRGSHISLIPTLYAEGTSLSCLEALASGNVVIASNVGGLPNLVLDNYNGLLISPTAASLRDALSRLFISRETCVEFARNGRAVAAAFRKQRWTAAWERLLTHVP